MGAAMYDHEKVPVWLRRQMQRRLDGGGDVRTIRRIAQAFSLRSRRTQGTPSIEPPATTVESNVIPFRLRSTLLGISPDRNVC